MPAQRKETGMVAWEGHSKSEPAKHCPSAPVCVALLSASLWNVNLGVQSVYVWGRETEKLSN